MRIAISGQLLGSTHSLGQILDLFRTLGVDAIDVWPHNFSGGESPEERALYQYKDVTGAKRVLDEVGYTVACVTLGARPMQQSAAGGPRIGTDALIGAVDAAVTLSARLVNCYLGGIATELFAEIARPAAEYAGRQGVTIVLENEAHDDSGTAAGVRAIVDAVGSPAFGALYDPCNFYQANDEPYPYAYDVLKDVVRYVHLKGGCRFDPARRPADHRGGTLRGSTDRYIGYVALPEAAFNVEGILRRLAADGYRGYLTLEPHVERDQAVRFYQIEVPYLRTLVDRVQVMSR